jgi:hypothetical protein
MGVRVRKTRGLAFWTLTGWDSEQSLRQYMLEDPHRQAMPKLANWCDEAAVGHWTQDKVELPAWEHVADHLVKHGRLSRVRYPSELHKSGRMSVT